MQDFTLHYNIKDAMLVMLCKEPGAFCKNAKVKRVATSFLHIHTRIMSTICAIDRSRIKSQEGMVVVPHTSDEEIISSVFNRVGK